MEVNYAHSCLCGRTEVMDEDVLLAAPPEVVRKGLSNAEWCMWMADFAQVLQDYAPSACSVALLTVGIITFPLAILRNVRFQKKVASFVARFNREALQPRGMLAKTQKLFYVRGEGDGDGVEVLSWLAIALDRDEALVLAAEDHIFDALGDPKLGRGASKGLSCCGVQVVV